MKKKIFFFLIPALFVFSAGLNAQNKLTKIQAINFSKVEIKDSFWNPIINKVSTVTIPVCIEQTEVKTPRIRNFEKVAAKKGEKHEGMYYDDSDVYKALEAIAYSLKNQPNPVLEEKADEWINKIALAQLTDGYLNTYYTLNGIDKRWSDMEKHEDYCAGHLIEAAVAYYNTTGKRKLLDVAIRLANHIDATFRKKNVHWVSGHEEIELALVKLYHTTNNKKYLDMADWYIQQRGYGYGKGVIWEGTKYPEYCQDNVTVKDQKKIVGHAVRAMYLYTGVADIAVLTNNKGYMDAIKSIWQDVVYRNMYITGGIGSSAQNEGFSANFDLPNESAYCETCASVGMVIWNQRMNLLAGDAKYIDVLERSFYNGALDGLSFSGDHFFYGNPLASRGNYSRSEWFGTACCPSNIARLIESLGNYIYAKSEDAIWINLFVGSSTNITLKNRNIGISQMTQYPWNGEIQITVNPEKSLKFGLHVRVPGWAQNQPVPGDTYSFVDTNSSVFTLTVNGKLENYKLLNGYVYIERNWKKGDNVILNLPMPVRRIKAIDKVKDDIDCVALQRGPLVYCFEQVDNDVDVAKIILADSIKMNKEFNVRFLNGVVVLKGISSVQTLTADGLTTKIEDRNITAIPYYSWANRGTGTMQIWMPRKIIDVKITPYLK